MITILVNKIASLALIMMLGWLLVKSKVLKAEDAQSLSRLALYLIMPCVIISAFQVDYTEDVKNGLFLACFAAAVIHLVLMVFSALMRKLLGLDPVEQAAVIYSNAGNLIIPLVSAMLGSEWVIYTSGYIVVQLILIWSHGKAVLCGEKGIQLKKIFSNVNMIAIVVGVVLYFTQIRFPKLIQDTMDTIGGMTGPASMLVIGMLLGRMDMKKLLSYKRVWLIAFLRLIVAPLLVLPLLKFTGITGLAADGARVLLVTFLAVTTPSAASLTHLSQVYGQNAEYTCAINVITTILCIATLPVMVMLYQM